MKETQKLKVLKIVNSKHNQKTFDIMRKGLKQFVTDASRCLRYLAEEGLVVGEYVEGKSYKKWNITQAGKDYLNERH